LDEYAAAVAKNDLIEVADALTDRLYVLLGDYHAHGLGELLEPLFDEVQASNMSKLTEDGQVLRREDGKVLKSDRFFKPDLAKVINNWFLSPMKPKVDTRKPTKERLRDLVKAGTADEYMVRNLLDKNHISFDDYLYALGADENL